MPQMGKEPAYTSANALDDLGGKPDEAEIQRLKKYYPTYQFVHRTQLLQGMFDGGSSEELILGKLTAKGLDTSITKQAKGGHGNWVHDFAYWTHPVSDKWTHLAWVTGGAANWWLFYASFLREASFLALTPR